MPHPETRLHQTYVFDEGYCKYVGEPPALSTPICPHQLRVHRKLMIFYAYADCAARDFPFHVFNINPHNYICNYVGGGSEIYIYIYILCIGGGRYPARARLLS